MAEKPESTDEPISRRALLASVGAGIALLGLAAVIHLAVAPAVNDSYWCHDSIGGWVALGGFAAFFAGLVVAFVALLKADGARLWASALAALPGLAMVVIGVLLMKLYGDTWGSAGCRD